MGISEWVSVGLFVVTGFFTILWYLLQHKDASQEKELVELWRKHDEDAKSLQELRLQIAEGHYKKIELDNRFEKFEEAIKHGFEGLGEKFDSLSLTLVNHIQLEDKRNSCIDK
jgi:hypothetical protein